MSGDSELTVSMPASMRRAMILPLLLHKLVDTATEALIIVDRQGSIIFFNKRAEVLFGWESDEVVNSKIEILLPDHLKHVHTTVHRPKYEASPHDRAMGADLNLLARHKTGSTFPVLVDLKDIDLREEAGDLSARYTRAEVRAKHG